MSTRSRNRSDLSAARPPLVGRLHEMVTTRRPVSNPEPQVRWQRPHLARWLYVDAMRRTRRPGIVLDQSEPDRYALLDENAGGERLSAYADSVLNPLTFEHVLSTSPRLTTGEW